MRLPTMTQAETISLLYIFALKDWKIVDKRILILIQHPGMSLCTITSPSLCGMSRIVHDSLISFAAGPP